MVDSVAMGVYLRRPCTHVSPVMEAWVVEVPPFGNDEWLESIA